MEPFIAQITMFGGNFAPRGWAFCNGQLLAISSYSAVFSLMGTTFGGDGRSTFGLPDLRGRVPIHVGGNTGQGPGLSAYRWGQRGGGEYNVLTTAQLPSHNHAASGKIKAFGGDGTTNEPGNNVPAIAKVPIDRTNVVDANVYTNAANGYMAADGVAVTVGNTGGSQEVNNLQPYLGINFIIALVGVFPSRS